MIYTHKSLEEMEQKALQAQKDCQCGCHKAQQAVFEAKNQPGVVWLEHFLPAYSEKVNAELAADYLDQAKKIANPMFKVKNKQNNLVLKILQSVAYLLFWAHDEVATKQEYFND